MPNIILLNKELEEGNKEQIIINNDNFEEFKNIVKAMFCLDVASGGKYNPANKLAEQIAKKLEERRKKLEAKHDGKQ